jgi:hypothetical protein
MCECLNDVRKIQNKLPYICLSLIELGIINDFELWAISNFDAIYLIHYAVTTYDNHVHKNHLILFSNIMFLDRS